MSDIITPGQPADNKVKLLPPMTWQDFDKLSTAFTRFIELREMVVKTAAHEAELKGLVEFLSNELLNRAHELLGCWHAVRTEYEPAVNAVANLLSRVDAVRAQRMARQQPSNVVPLNPE